MSKVDQYGETLRSLPDWEGYLKSESGLPGPRGNLELAEAAARLASRDQIEGLLRYSAGSAENTPEVFLVFCGVLALGRLLAEGNREVLPRLQHFANDSRWRIRESVAMAMQWFGDACMEDMLEVAQSWARGTLLEQRAAVAAICEPRLLAQPQPALTALDLLDLVTQQVVEAPDRKLEAFQTLRKALGYGWSVVIVALPAEGKKRFERWARSTDKDVLWIVRENLKKNRLSRMDAGWVEAMQLAFSATIK